MSKIIKDKIYELVTKPENFDFACDLNQEFSGITEKLEESFWQDLVSEVKKEIKTKGMSCELATDYELKIYRKKNALIDYWMSWTEENKIQLYIGTDNSSRKFANTFSDFFIKVQEKLPEYVFDRYYAYFDFEETLNVRSGWNKILPNNRENLIEKYKNALIHLIDNTAELVTELEDELTE